jgi:hypothetical protein
MENNGAGPVGAQLGGGLNLEVFFDVDPEKYPDGVQLMVMLPGQVGVPIVGVSVKRGAMLIALHPDQAKHLRSQLAPLQKAASGVQVVPH